MTAPRSIARLLQQPFMELPHTVGFHRRIRADEPIGELRDGDPFERTNKAAICERVNYKRFPAERDPQPLNRRLHHHVGMTKPRDTRGLWQYLPGLLGPERPGRWVAANIGKLVQQEGVMGKIRNRV